MNPQYDYLWKELTSQLEQLALMPIPEIQQAERGFWLAQTSWQQLQLLLKEKTWQSPEEEIDFFRNTKPAFTSLIYYYLLLCEALTCIPQDPGQCATYWESEAGRFDRFRKNNPYFVRYLEMGWRHQDAIYYRPQASHQLTLLQSYIADSDPRFNTPYDLLLSRYLAYQKFARYCLRKKWNCGATSL